MVHDPRRSVAHHNLDHHANDPNIPFDPLARFAPNAPLNTSASWAAASSGNWATKTNWSNNAVPTASTDATIAVAGKYTVTIGSASTAASLTLNDAQATVADNAAFTVGGTIGLTAGTFSLKSGGVLNGGTVVTNGGQFVAAGGTLNGVAFDGTLNLSPPPIEFAGVSLTVSGATVFAGANGTAAGTVNLSSTNLDGDAYLYALGNYTLDNAVLNIGSDNDFTSATLYNQDAKGGATLTLGPKLTINLTNLEAAIASDDKSGDTIINKGTIDAGYNGGTLTIDATNFTNQGAINVSNGCEIVLSGIETALLTNSINRLSGGLVGIGGIVTGGTIDASTSGIIGAGGTLIGVAFDGTLNLSPPPIEFAGVSLTVSGATVFAGANGTAAGTVNLSSTNLDGDAHLYALGNYTLNNAVLNIGSDNYFTSATLYNQDAKGGATLTLGPKLTINLTNLEAAIASDDKSGDTIINKGTIDAGYNGGTLTIDATNFTNQGAINVSNGCEIVLSGIETALLTNSINRFSGGLVGIGGIVTGGTIDASTSGIIGAGGTLIGVAFDGTLNLSPPPIEFAGVSLTVSGATVFAGANGTAAGTVNLSSTNLDGDAYLYALGNYTLDNAVLNIGSDNDFTSATLYNQDAKGGATLTLGPKLTINLINLEAAIASDDRSGDAIINKGTIDAGYNGGTLTIDATNFTNQGAINVSNGCEIVLSGIETALLTNSINRFSGGLVGIGGIVTGGTIDASTSGIIGAGGTLIGVAFDGTLNLSPPPIEFAGVSLTVSGATVFAGANGTAAGTVNLSSTNLDGDAYLYALGNYTLDNAVLNIGSDNDFTSATLYNQDAKGGATLTLGPKLTINLINLEAAIASDDRSGDAIINKGTIDAGYNGGTLTIDATNFTNAGSLVAANGSTLSFSGGALTNLSSNTLTGGYYEIDSNSTLQLANNLSITTDAATIVLSGTSSVLESKSGSTQITLDSTLATIAAAGTLEILAGRAFAAAGAFTDAGALQLASSATFTASSGLTIASGGSLSGNGTVTAAIANSGSIEAKGALLTITGAITGTGALQIDANATLELGAAVAAGQTATFSGQGGTLKLDAPLNFAGTLAGFGAGDTLDLAGVAAASAFTSGATLDVVLGNGGTLAFNLAAALPAERFATVSDNNGGTDIVGYRLATASVAPTSLTLRNVHVGDSDSAQVSVTNTAAADGYSEKLDASFTAVSGSATDSGSITGLAPGATGTLSVGLATTAAGSLSGSATIGLSTDGAGTDGQGAQSIGSQTVAVAGAVYAYAAGTLASSNLAFGNHHVGDVVSQSLTLTNSGPASGGYTEGLDAVLAGATGGLTAAGSLNNLTQGATDTSSLSLGLNTGTAGAISGSATLSLTSDGSIDGLGNTGLAPVTIAGSGSVFAYAAAQLGATTINLGIHHVGDSVMQALTLTNAGPGTGGYTEALDAYLTGGTGGISGTGSLSGLGAQATNTTSLLVGLNTASAGTESGTVTLGAASDGTGIDGLGTTTLGNQIINVTGTINNYATLQVEQVVGKNVVDIANGGTINLGSVAVGGKALSVTLGMLNSATGPADVLGGSFAASGKGFTLKNFTTFSSLGAGHDERMQVATLKTSKAGVFTEKVTISAAGSNASGYSGALPSETITIVGTITAAHAAFLPSETPAADTLPNLVPDWSAFDASLAAPAPERQAAAPPLRLLSDPAQAWSPQFLHVQAHQPWHLS